MALTDLTVVTRSLTGRLFSTVVTALTVTVAVALLLVLLGLRDAGRQAFSRGPGNMHLLVTAEPSPLVSVLNSIYYASAPRNYIPWDTYQELADPQGPPTRDTAWKYDPGYWVVPNIQGDSYRGRPVVATNTDFFTRFQPIPGQPWTLTDGRIFTNDALEIVVGADAAQRLGLRIGDVINLVHGGSFDTGAVADGGHVHSEFDFTIVGILSPTGTPHDRALFTTLTASWILHAHDRRLAEANARGEPSSSVTITQAGDITDADRKVTAVYMHLGTREGSSTPPGLQQAFYQLRADRVLQVAQPRDQINTLFEIVGSIDQIFIAIAGVVMLSSGVAIMLALYNSMEQRRRQVAVLRVLGASKLRVFGLVITESAVIGIMGAAAGVIVALVGIHVVADIVRAEHGIVIEPNLPPVLILGVFVGSVALAAIAGLVPSIMAYRTSVVRNLRPVG